MSNFWGAVHLQKCYVLSPEICKNVTCFFAEILPIIPPKNSFLQKCYIFPTPYIGIGMAIYDSFKLAYFLLNDRFLYIWAALISKISSSDKLLATKSRTMRFAISTFFILNEI